MIMDRYLWTPGEGMDAESLSRLRARFPRPAEPMGEAWFMSETRRLHHELMGDLDVLSADQLCESLWDIASGTSCFGPDAEWDDWFHYLLAQLLPRSHEGFFSLLLEPLITCFIALHPNGVSRAFYPHFRDDSLLTLGRCLMDPRLWTGDEIVVGTFLHRSNNNPNRVWGWWDASGDFSASVFFCMKYLPPERVAGWFDSVLAIPSPHWRAQVLAWLVGADDILRGRIRWPSDFPERVHPSVAWEFSHCLDAQLATNDVSGAEPMSSFLPGQARACVIEGATRYFSKDVFLAWMESISQVPYVESELGQIPSMFERMYVQSKLF